MFAKFAAAALSAVLAIALAHSAGAQVVAKPAATTAQKPSMPTSTSSMPRPQVPASGTMQPPPRPQMPTNGTVNQPPRPAPTAAPAPQASKLPTR